MPNRVECFMNSGNNRNFVEEGTYDCKTCILIDRV
jgi:hypothetical protein